MRSSMVRSAKVHALAIAAIAIAATSCSRALPTAPESGVDRSRYGADAFATQGLENQVAIVFQEGTDAARIARDYGAIVVTQESEGRTAALRPLPGQSPAALMDRLLLDPRVVTSEPNTWIEPAEARQQSFAFDDGFGNAGTFAGQASLAQLGLDHAHDISTGQGVKVAIIDTGLDLKHPALRHRLVAGWDFVGNDPNPTDVRDFIDNDRDGRADEAYGHGTHVAGIVTLVAPGARIMPIRVLDADGRGDIVNVTAGVRWAIEQGAKVINLSLGTSTRCDALQDVLEEAKDAGVIVIATAGNWGTDAVVDFPGRSSHVLCIAAVDGTANGAAFSSRGGDVTISAPGVAVRSTYPGGGYRLWTGTSMSAPFVTGAAALLAEEHPGWGLVEVEDRLTLTARRLASAPAGAQTRDYGAGALDVAAALRPDFVPGPNSDPGPEEIRPR